MSLRLISVSLVALLILLSACIVLMGCGAVEDMAAPVVDDIGVDAMGIDQKRSLAAEFPFQVPVIAGEVIAASGSPEAGGGGLWEYVIQSGLDPAYVSEWYVRSYTVADWALVERREASAGGEVLTFTKGAGAESLIRVAEYPEGTRVEAAVGIGVSVTTTF